MQAFKTAAFVFFIVLQVLPHPSSTLWLLNHGKNLNPYSRGEGDIEIGPDPSFQCPPNTPIAPHPERCELYYTCYAGYPVTLWQCYSDYLFDLRYSGCNFPYDTDCGDRQRPGATTIVTTISPPFSCPGNGYYPVSACSSQYYLCVSGNIYPQVCPNDSVFDPILLYCVSPDQLPACGDSTTQTEPATTLPTTTTTINNCDVTTVTPSEFTCPDNQTGFYPIYPGACSAEYYTCYAGVAYPQQCQEGYIFVASIDACVSVAAAGCTPCPNIM